MLQSSHPLKKKKTVSLLDDLTGKDSDDLLKNDDLAEMGLTGEEFGDLSQEVEELTNASLLKHKEVTTDNDDRMLNGSSNKLADKSKDIDMSSLEDGPEDILASSTKPGLNRDGVRFADKVVMGGAKDVLPST